MIEVNDAFRRIMGNPAKKADVCLLTAEFITTPIGRMLDNNKLFLLEFENRRGLEKEIERLRLKQNARIISVDDSILQLLSKELNAHFTTQSAHFSVSLYQEGTIFQCSVWKLLQSIPPGKTRTYKELALALDDSHKVSGASNANGANQIAILVLCHRVVSSSGELGSYGGGIERKRYLLE